VSYPPMSSTWRLLRVGALTSLAIMLTAGRLAGQSESLERVDELVRMGRADEARAMLLEWWNDGRADASRRDLQRGLWLRGRLTVDPVQAELDFQRLVVLYPRGPFTPEAILRLAQAAHAMGDGEGALRHVATLVRDYPDTPAREQAEAWLRTAGPAPPPPDAAVVEPPPSGPDTVVAVIPPPQRGPATRSSVGTYFVQLGAFAEEARALTLYEEVEARGVDVRVVRVEGSRFLHVRFGRFEQREEAVAEVERLTAAGITAALVRDERAETLVRN
jgi:hypothetical protein